MINKTQPYEKLVDYIKNNPNKGQTIPHADVEVIMGIPYRAVGCMHLNSQYSYQVQKANKKLTELSLRLEAIQGFGYRILRDNQYVDSMRKAYNMGVRNMEKAKFIGDNTDVTTLTAKENAEFDAVYKKVSAAHKSLVIIPSPTMKIKKNTP
jgi:hypothetical protein